jgi:hypothetical protein
MNKFTISMDDLDDMLSKLWEYCQGKGTFRALPDKNLIEVYEYIDGSSQAGSRLVSEISIVSIDDVFDVKEFLFKKE